MILAGRTGGGRHGFDGEVAPHSRWPGWGILPAGAGGHGGICRGLGRSLGEPADCFAIDADLARDLVLRDAAPQERQHCLLLLWLQDIHLRIPSFDNRSRGDDVLSRCDRLRRRIRDRDALQMGDFQVATAGGVWVAVGVHPLSTWA